MCMCMGVCVCQVAPSHRASLTAFILTAPLLLRAARGNNSTTGVPKRDNATPTSEAGVCLCVCFLCESKSRRSCGPNHTFMLVKSPRNEGTHSGVDERAVLAKLVRAMTKAGRASEALTVQSEDQHCSN